MRLPLLRPKLHAWTLAVLAAAFAPHARASGPRSLKIDAREAGARRAWQMRIAQLTASGALAVRADDDDPFLPGRRHRRLRQIHRGVPVLGADVVQQLEGDETVSVFGTLVDGIDVDPVPALTADQALDAVETLSGVDIGPVDERGPDHAPRLVVLPLDDGRAALVWQVRAVSRRGILLYSIEARTGALVDVRDDARTQTPVVGSGTGVLGDAKKISVRTQAGGYAADDGLRPLPLWSFDLRSDFDRTVRYLNGVTPLRFTELARDDDNQWTDGAVVDAHTYAGWTYDYYFKRMGRHGLDDRNKQIVNTVHPVRRQDYASHSDEVVGLFFTNAFYAGNGNLVFGEGLPPGVTDEVGRGWNYLSGALDVVAHELTHGVTEFTSDLMYQGESGALNEAFSDIMGTSVEFFFQPAGDGPMRADYLLGEDVVTPGGLRSMQNPASLGHPDHYSRLFHGTQDNGGVHINSTIVSHAFYLAIEGGTNRVSGLAVQGVGPGNREQIEKVFYRAFARMLPARADFALARAATVQSARDLYGAGSAAERAVSQAWTAVGLP